MDLKKLQALKDEIWRADLAPLPPWKAYGIRFLRIVILVSQGFSKSQIQQGASALTYYSLLALVPVIALLVGLSRGFNLEEPLKEWLISHITEQKEVIFKLFDFADRSLKAVHQGLIAGVGILILFWSCIKIFINIEQVLNTIWEVKEGRSFARRFTDYLALILLFPLLILLSSGITVYLSTALTTLAKGGLLEQVGPFLLPLLNLIPICLTCFLFTFFYIFIPNTRVHFFPALWAGLVAGLTYQIMQWLYLYFQIGVTRYNAIYGTFAAFPLLLIWIHLSWVILFLGAKMSFAFQNVNAFDFISEDVLLSHRFRMILSLRIAHLCTKQFCKGAPPSTPIEISNKLSIPLPVTAQLLYQLVASGILSEVKRAKDEESAFQPARSVDQLTIKSVIDMINQRGEEIPLPPSYEMELILKSLEKFNQALELSDGNLLLKDI